MHFHGGVSGSLEVTPLVRADLVRYAQVDDVFVLRQKSRRAERLLALPAGFSLLAPSNLQKCKMATFYS